MTMEADVLAYGYEMAESFDVEEELKSAFNGEWMKELSSMDEDLDHSYPGIDVFGNVINHEMTFDEWHNRKKCA